MPNRVAPRGTNWVWLLGLVVGIGSGALVVYLLAVPLGTSASAEIARTAG